MNKKEKFTNLLEATKFFSSEEVCRGYLEKLIWEDKPVCPYCKNKEIYRFSDKKRFKCKRCFTKFTITIGTVLENTKVPLQKWMLAVYLVTATKKGISSVQLSKDIGVTQKTAWFMLQRIREMVGLDNIEAFEDIVEVDETYIGGKYKNKHYNKRLKNQQGRGGSEKTPVFGMLQRNGKVLSMKVPDTKSTTLKPIIDKYINRGTIICSDEWRGYRGLKNDYNHFIVNHSRYQYVDGLAHTNTLEGYWSLVKRNIHGTYHYISRKHLNRYCAEFDFRYNNRKLSTIERFNIALSDCKGRLKYKDLIKQEINKSQIGSTLP